MTSSTPGRVPVATYRLQLGAGFGFAAAAAVVDYLHALGVSHAYFSPVFRARAGSPHGYDVGGAVSRDGSATAESWAALWYGWVSGSFLRAYLEEAGGTVFLPRDMGELDDLLVVHVLEKAVYELAYELNNRPSWVRLPLQGIAALVEGED